MVVAAVASSLPGGLARAMADYDTPSPKRPRVLGPDAVLISGGTPYPAPFIALWRAEQFCDIIVSLDDGARFPASRQVLAAGSEYMATALRQTRFTSPDATHPIREMRSSCFSACLEFMYAGETSV